jgi:hypothetical protein
MKKFYLLFLFLTLSIYIFGQATPSGTFRVATQATAFGKNLPAGTHIFCVADSTSYWVKGAGIAAAGTVRTGLDAGTISMQKTDLTIVRSDTMNVVKSNAGDGNEGTSVQIISANGSSAGLLSAANYNKLNAISAGAGVTWALTYEATLDSLSNNSHVVLPYAAKDSTSFVVSLNGNELTRWTGSAGQYFVLPLASKTVKLRIPVYKYDIFSVSYTK